MSNEQAFRQGQHRGAEGIQTSQRANIETMETVKYEF